MKNTFKLVTLVSIAVMSAGSASAVTLAEAGEFFDANASNTVDFLTDEPVNTHGWTIANTGVNGTTGFNHNLSPDVAVTTITNLIPNQLYSVGVVYANDTDGVTNFSAGLSSDSFTQAPDVNPTDTLTGVAVTGGPFVAAYFLALGEVAANSAGQIQVFADDGTETNVGSSAFSYAGVTLQAVPEPSSLALLGLAGGLGLLRRRR